MLGRARPGAPDAALLAPRTERPGRSRPAGSRPPASGRCRVRLRAASARSDLGAALGDVAHGVRRSPGSCASHASTRLEQARRGQQPSGSRSAAPSRHAGCPAARRRCRPRPGSARRTAPGRRPGRAGRTRSRSSAGSRSGSRGSTKACCQAASLASASAARPGRRRRAPGPRWCRRAPPPRRSGPRRGDRVPASAVTRTQRRSVSTSRPGDARRAVEQALELVEGVVAARRAGQARAKVSCRSLPGSASCSSRARPAPSARPGRRGGRGRRRGSRPWRRSAGSR